MKILVIDNTLDPDSWGSSDLVAAVRRAAGDAEIHVRRAPDQDWPRVLDSFTHWILSGSRIRADEALDWIEDLCAKVIDAIDRDVAVLGVCFGHQVIARAYGGVDSVGVSPSPELGWVAIRQMQFNPIFQGAAETFVSAVRHFDEVYRLPEQFEVTAHSDRCAIQAFKMKQKPVFGIQFHPEKTWEQMEKYRGEQFYFGEGLKSKVDQLKLAGLIFGNFFKIQ